MRKTVDSDLIMSLGPCDDWPESRVREAVPERVSLVEFLRAEHIPAVDRLWVALRRDFLGDRLLRLFACDCAERALQCECKSGCWTDPRSWNAIAVARRYANGEVTEEDLDSARLEAWAYADVASDYAAAAACVASRSASNAAWSASACAAERYRYAESVHERTWQLNHLAAMIEAEK